MRNHPLFPRPFPQLVLILLLAACARQPALELAGTSSQQTDFVGAWELDYSQSDEIQARLRSLIRELRRQAERQGQGRADSRGGPVISVGPGGANSADSVISLARLADYITRSQLLDIEQDPRSIRVKREENFALSCEFHGDEPARQENPLGSEICGWDGHQLVFWVILPDGIRVNHRFSLGPDGKRLNIATTVMTDRVSSPVTLNRVYNRYDPESGGIRCEQTLSRGRVCTTERP
jgi:hypothetical protein